MNLQDIIHFWFEEITPKQWWVKDAAFDQMIKDRFESVLAQAKRCELSTWRQTALGRLAEIIVLDQFSRNIYRDQPEAFAADALALALAQEAVHQAEDQKLPPSQRAFLYMPYMHSESSVIHKDAMELFAAPGMEHNLDFEKKHKAIIDRFGRYPHRNQILGRTSTAEEEAFLKEPGSSF